MRYRVVPLPGGAFAKVPVGFGLASLAHGWAELFGQYNAGRLDPGSALQHALFHTWRQTLPDTFPAYKILDDPVPFLLQTLMPQFVRPALDVGFNKNHWGDQLIYGNNEPGLRNFEKGRVNTGDRWHDMARLVYEYSGGLIDIHPETLRHVVSGYAWGPLQGIVAALDSSRVYEREFASTRSALGPVLTALGAASLYGAPQNLTASRWYFSQRAINRSLARRGIRLTDPANRTSADKAAFIRKGAEAAGAPEDWIRAVLKYVDTGRELDKINEATRRIWESRKAGELSVEEYRRLRREHEKAQNLLFERFYRETRGVDLWL
jgi:hypothetical protein